MYPSMRSAPDSSATHLHEQAHGEEQPAKLCSRHGPWGCRHHCGKTLWQKQKSRDFLRLGKGSYTYRGRGGEGPGTFLRVNFFRAEKKRAKKENGPCGYPKGGVSGGHPPPRKSLQRRGPKWNGNQRNLTHTTLCLGWCESFFDV